jgi:hypothetical protein
MEGDRMVNIKTPTYEPIGDELTGSNALFQAAATLDAAVFLAVESRNVGKLMDAAAMWIGLAERLGIDIENIESPSPEHVRSFGFNNKKEKESDA